MFGHQGGQTYSRLYHLCTLETLEELEIYQRQNYTYLRYQTNDTDYTILLLKIAFDCRKNEKAHRAAFNSIK